uniref:CSON002520 protein n=1 Tax=Culicoides sonorensis TaxID=179676 RepID=A0A336LVY4_CULSO
MSSQTMMMFFLDCGLFLNKHRHREIQWKNAIDISFFLVIIIFYNYISISICQNITIGSKWTEITLCTNTINFGLVIFYNTHVKSMDRMGPQQIIMEDQITTFVANHSKQMQERIFQTEVEYEKKLLEHKRKKREMEEKLKALEKETNDKVQQCKELETMLKGYKEKLSETEQKISEDKAVYDAEKERIRRRYERKIEDLEAQLKQQKVEKNKSDDTGVELVRKLEALKKSLDKNESRRKSDDDDVGGFITANASFHELPIEVDDHHNINELIEKIDKLINHGSDTFSINAYDKQITKLEKELAASREQSIIDRQSARSAHLQLWKLEKQIGELENEKKTLTRRCEYANDKVKAMKEEADGFQLKLQNTKELVTVKETAIRDLNQTIRDLKHDRQLERNLRINYEKECVRQKAEILEHLAKIKSLEEIVETNSRMLNEVQQKNDDLIAEQEKLKYDLEQKMSTCSLANTITADKNRELVNLQRNYEFLKKACSITDKQITELESKLKSEEASKRIDQKKIKELQSELSKRNTELHVMRRELTEEKDARQRADSTVEKLQEEINEIKQIRQHQTEQALDMQKEIKDVTSQAMEHQHRIKTLIDQLQSLKSTNQANEKQIHFLKEDNTKILSDLFLAREEIQDLKCQLDDYNLEMNNLMHELNIKEGILMEQKNCQTQMEIKSTSTIAQCKKLIEHLQQEVGKKKKNRTFAEKILGLEGTPAK